MDVVIKDFNRSDTAADELILEFGKLRKSGVVRRWGRRSAGAGCGTGGGIVQESIESWAGYGDESDLSTAV
jgi:hypothetical protein